MAFPFHKWAASAAALEAAKATAERQLADLQKQNADLLAKLNETTNHLANQNTATQQKLDEILNQTGPLVK